MLNTFPMLLYPFFAPLILRVAVGLLFVGVGVRTWRHAARLAEVSVPVLGKQAWVPYFVGLFELALGLMFLAGWYTQVAAIIAIIGVIKYAVYRRWWPQVLAGYFPVSPTTAVLLAVICLSLLISGAGAFAQDLPL
ncbi:MAG TPA: DoxX family membrane protein [Candidatus Paceibacterota bacterium]|jgi:uncharacterized membrane protein YphA (DoxX/SURF4 family)|nr:DoxX family membrane protein [Candidatus Paceibacterota bacterium]